MADAYFSNVSLLLPLDGPAGGTTFRDYSANHLAITTNGNTSAKAVGKHNGSAAYFDGTGDYLSIPASSGFRFGSSTDFTIELFILQVSRPVAYPRAIQFSNTCNTSNSWALVPGHGSFSTNKFVVHIWAHNGNSAALLVGTTSIVFNQFYHVAITRSGTTWRLFVDGVLEASATWSGSPDSSDNTLNLGAVPDAGFIADSSFHGYLSDLRITKGVARYV